MTTIHAQAERKRQDRSVCRAEKRLCRARMLRVRGLIHPTSAVCATTDTARGEKRLPSEQNQAILKSSGRPLGECRFALDDFGAGITSLRLLREMRFEIVKIDGSLVKNVDTSVDGQAIARAAIAVAQEMNMYVVAEAVETEGEANWLRDAGVGCMQGYLFGPPTVTPDFRAFRRGRPNLAERTV